MGLLDKLRAELVDIVEWVDDGRHTLVWRFPRYHNQIKNGAQLIVRPGQMAVFVREGKLADVFGPGQHTLETPQPAGALDARGLDVRLRQPVQGRGLLRQHAADHRPEVGHAQPGAAARPRLRPGARARLRHLHAARARPEALLRAAGRHRLLLRGRRDRRAAARDHRHRLRRSGREVGDRAARSRRRTTRRSSEQLRELARDADRRRVRARDPAALHRERLGARRGGAGARRAHQHERDRRSRGVSGLPARRRRCRSPPRTRRAASRARASASGWAWRSRRRCWAAPPGASRRRPRRCRAPPGGSRKAGSPRARSRRSSWPARGACGPTRWCGRPVKTDWQPAASIPALAGFLRPPPPR